MRVFLSWSGDPSRAVAEELFEWLPTVIQAVKPWLSARDIRVGSRWATEVSAELEQSRYGIICLTPNNTDAPWILFESGALSKQVGSARVAPYLLGIEPSAVTGPLSQFQMARANADDTRKLLHSINATLGDARLDQAHLDKAFARAWKELEDALNRIAAQIGTADAAVKPQQPDQIKMLQELLELARAQERRARERDQTARIGAALAAKLAGTSSISADLSTASSNLAGLPPGLLASVDEVLSAIPSGEPSDDLSARLSVPMEPSTTTWRPTGIKAVGRHAKRKPTGGSE